MAEWRMPFLVRCGRFFSFNIEFALFTLSDEMGKGVQDENGLLNSETRR